MYPAQGLKGGLDCLPQRIVSGGDNAGPGA